MRILRYFSIFFVLGYAAWYFYAGDKPYQSISGQTMGTYYNVKIRTRKEDNMLPQKIRQRLDELNREMSVFDSESEISRLNNAKAGEWIDLSPEMSKVMKDSAKIWRLSGGAFDPTVGRLVDLWGFGASVPKKAPSEAEIKEVLKYTGFDKLKFADGYSRVKRATTTFTSIFPPLPKATASTASPSFWKTKATRISSLKSAARSLPAAAAPKRKKAGKSVL